MKSFFQNRSFILIVASVAFVCFSVVLIVNLANKAVDKKKEYESISSKFEEESSENEELEKELESGISEEEKEYIARDELGYILPGEHVYADAS